MEETHLVHAQRAVQKDFFFLRNILKKQNMRKKKSCPCFVKSKSKDPKKVFFLEKHIPNKLSHARDKDIT